MATRRGTGVGSTVGVRVQVLEVPVGASARVLAGVVVVGLVDLGSDGAVLLQVRAVLVTSDFMVATLGLARLGAVVPISMADSDSGVGGIRPDKQVGMELGE